MMEIAIIAHDGMKAEMVQFLNRNRDLLAAEGIRLVATGTTGSKAEKAGFRVKKMLSGPLGGDAQIAARVCDVHNVPLATNEATAQMLLAALQK